MPESELAELAEWLALTLPARKDAPEQRQLLADAAALYRRRGTPAGIREMVRRLLGAHIHVFEAFRERRVWQLGAGEGLGLGTQLAAGAPSGLVVPGYTYADRALLGLRGDYYSGDHFDVLRHTTRDTQLNFPRVEDGKDIHLDITEYLPPNTIANEASFRWSGQIRPRYSETYTFRTTASGAVRLWIGHRLIVDTSVGVSGVEGTGQIHIETGRWYPIVLEVSARTSKVEIALRWSSASQRSEVVPQECLYSVWDESAEIEPARHGGCQLMEVGQAIVGEGRPQDAGDYGKALADDYAHLFTVVVPAAQVPLATQRQALRELIEAEKPAHTDFNLCLVEPRMRVGVQARLGVDSIVAGPGPAMRLGTVELGGDSYLDGKVPMIGLAAGSHSAPATNGSLG